MGRWGSAPRVALAATLAWALAFGTPPALAGDDGVLVVDGAGWGHGVGMAQDGAYWMGRAGADTLEILGRFYPGTRLARARGAMRVVLGGVGSGPAVLRFPAGGEVREGSAQPGFGVRVVPGGELPVTFDGARYHLGAIPAPASPNPLWAVPAPGGTVDVPAFGHRYRGLVEISGTGPGGVLHLVNRLPVEDYLRGMGEVRDPAWPPAALQAQAIAARTYALRAMAAGGQICADQRCQVYLGQDAEYPAMDQAVTATAGMVLTFDGTFASTVYSANAGGVSASREEGFGPAAAGPGHPYLKSTPYLTQDRHPWSVRVTLPVVAARLGYPGELDSVTVEVRGPSGRALALTLAGRAGLRTVTGKTFATALGLQSTLFQVAVERSRAETAPPGPPVLQVPPEEAAAGAELPVAPAAGVDAPTLVPVSSRFDAVGSRPRPVRRPWAWAGAALLLVPAGRWVALARRRPDQGARPA